MKCIGDKCKFCTNDNYFEDYRFCRIDIERFSSAGFSIDNPPERCKLRDYILQQHKILGELENYFLYIKYGISEDTIDG